MITPTVIESQIGKGLSYIAKTKPMQKQLEKGFKNPTSFVVTMLVTSLVTKDAVNCYYYVTQSLNNERIPEEKRKFVASLDLMNGIMNVVGQIAIGMLLEKTLSKKLFNKTVNSKIDEDSLALHAKKIVAESKEKLDVKKVHAELIKKYGAEGSKFQSYQGGAKLLVGFLLTAAFAKRVLTPLIATPLAGWFKDKYMNDAPKKETGKENLDDKLLSHETAPWAKTEENKTGTKLNKVSK